ncbi:MAG: hypothetical protein WCR91_08530, partial [Sphaerochaetaceae bacterium]
PHSTIIFDEIEEIYPVHIKVSVQKALLSPCKMTDSKKFPVVGAKCLFFIASALYMRYNAENLFIYTWFV